MSLLLRTPPLLRHPSSDPDPSTSPLRSYTSLFGYPSGAHPHHSSFPGSYGGQERTYNPSIPVTPVPRKDLLSPPRLNPPTRDKTCRTICRPYLIDGLLPDPTLPCLDSLLRTPTERPCLYQTPFVSSPTSTSTSVRFASGNPSGHRDVDPPESGGISGGRGDMPTLLTPDLPSYFEGSWALTGS